MQIANNNLNTNINKINGGLHIYTIEDIIELDPKIYENLLDRSLDISKEDLDFSGNREDIEIDIETILEEYQETIYLTVCDMVA